MRQELLLGLRFDADYVPARLNDYGRYIVRRVCADQTEPVLTLTQFVFPHQPVSETHDYHEGTGTWAVRDMRRASCKFAAFVKRCALSREGVKGWSQFR